jgi:hypothetical protein
MANIYKEFLWGLTTAKKKKKEKLFMGLNRVFNTKQHKTKINFKTKVKFP